MENEVFFNSNSLIKINDETIREIKDKARLNKSGKYRLCMQHNSSDYLHEMFIVRHKGDYGRPDKHLYTTESHTIIDGSMLVVLFEDNGQIRELFELSKEGYYTYRIDTNIFHMQIPLTEQVVYYEVKLGPFTEKSNIFPDWAPHPQDFERVKEFMGQLGEKINTYRIQKGCL